MTTRLPDSAPEEDLQGVDAETAAEWARRLYGLDATARRLVADQDANFQLTGSGETRLLKVAAAGAAREEIDFQIAITERLRAAAIGVAIPEALPTLSGDACAEVTDPLGRPRLVRLQTFLEGRPLADVRPRPENLLAETGAVLGRLDSALSDFEHPADSRPLHWDLRRWHWVREHTDVLEGETQTRVAALLERIEARIEPLLGTLPRSVIHNDANDHNLLVQGSRRGRPRLSGLIDFGDALRTLTVAEPAIACAYLMMGRSDPLGAAAAIVAAYHRHRPLRAEEIDVLFPLIQLRLCLSLVISARRAREAPDNAYFQVSAGPARKLLERLEGSDGLARATLRHACGLSAGRSGPAVRELLAGAGAGRDVLPGFSTGSRVVLDLSFSSRDLTDRLAGPGLESALDQLIGGADFGIGRYDEARPIYRGPLFEQGRRRTVHLGIDLFAPAGTPVLAPLDGVVHGFADNSDAGDYGPTVLLRHETAGETYFSLYGHLSRESLDGLAPERELAAGEEIGRLGSAAENGGWPPHLHFQLITDLLGQRRNYPGVAPPEDRDLWLDLCPDPSPLLGLGRDARAPRPPDPEAMRAARKRLLSVALSLSYSEPLHIVRGEGPWLIDAEGRRYLDGVNNVAHVGHCHPRVVAAERRQAGLLNTNTRYLHESLLLYCERLSALLPEPLSVCFLVCSGSEANELALRLARAHTGTRETIVLEGGYHGNTTSLVEVSSYKFRGRGGFDPPEYVHPVPMPDPYRGVFRGSGGEVGRRYAGEVAATVEALQADGRGPATFLYEPLMGCGGQIVPPADFLKEAQAAVRERGGVCIADEVQVGFGRVGPAFWAFQLHGIVPDIVTMGKPIGNGYPLAAVVTTAEIAASFETGMEYFNTFGGNPVACEVGLAVLDVVQKEDLAARAAETGSRLLEGLRGLAETHPAVGDVRGEGLFVGLELVSDPEARTPDAERAAWIVERMKEGGVLLSTDGPEHNVVKIKPPLVFDASAAEFLLERLEEVLAHDFCRL